MDSFLHQPTSDKEKIMADQKPFDETIFPAANLNWDVTTLNFLLTLIRKTVIQKNHEIIIDTLKQMLTRLTDQERWEKEFGETIQSVLDQKEAAEKVVKYEGTIRTFDSESFMADISLFMFPSNGITKISFEINSTDGLHVIVSIPANASDIILGPKGFLSDSPWNEKFRRISGAPQAKKESGETITLPNGDTLQFVGKSWWLSKVGDLTSVDPPKTKEISRSAAWDLLAQNGILSEVSEEAFKDLNLED